MSGLLMVGQRPGCGWIWNPRIQQDTFASYTRIPAKPVQSTKMRRHRVAVLDRYGRDLAVLLQTWLEGRGDAAGRAPVPIAPP
jgi:hypothetical protein